MSAVRRSSLLVGVLLVITTAACSDDDDEVAATPSTTSSASAVTSASPAASPTASPTRSGPWLTEVNRLCEDLVDRTIEVRGGDGFVPTRESYLDQKPEIDDLIEEFDAKVDDISVSEDEQEAADTFKAYREFSDADDAHLKEAADTGDEAAFQKQFDAAAEPFRIQRAKLTAAGIDCDAR